MANKCDTVAFFMLLTTNCTRFFCFFCLFLFYSVIGSFACVRLLWLVEVTNWTQGISEFPSFSLSKCETFVMVTTANFNMKEKNYIRTKYSALTPAFKERVRRTWKSPIASKNHSAKISHSLSLRYFFLFNSFRTTQYNQLSIVTFLWQRKFWCQPQVRQPSVDSLLRHHKFQ